MLQNAALNPLGHARTPDGAGTHKERPCFVAECGRDRSGHTRALQGPFVDPGLLRVFRAGTHKERPCFAAECGFDRLGHTGTPDGLEQAHTKNGPVLLQNVASTTLGTHEHSRVHCGGFRADRHKERGGP